jgi:ribonuclease Z
MEQTRLTILGCGSALPQKDYNHSSQILEMRNKQFMIDCGEGTQSRLRQYHVKTSCMNHIFISHLHGDHCFGIIGLISTLGMMGRAADIEIHSHPDLEKLLSPMVNYFCSEFHFKINFNSFSPYKSEIIYEDKSLTVTTIPLKHRVPTCGFLFAEKQGERHIKREMAEAYEIPISFMKELKAGADFVTADGEIVPNKRLTSDPTPPKRYAYCSDTAYTEKLLPIIEGVDCLYHESTFLAEDSVRIKETLHSSAAQAATIAAKANVKQLILGHYSARYDNREPFLKEAKTIFENTFAAKDGDIYQI